MVTRPAAGWLVAYGLVSLVNVVSGLGGRGLVFGLTLFLAMPILVAALRATRRAHAQVGLVVAALVFSWLGDWAGGLTTILIKIAFFFGAQLCYVAAFWPYRARSALLRLRRGGVWALLIMVLLVIIVPGTGALAPAVIIYGCSLGLMVVLATGVHPFTAVGAACFLVSDSFIALTTFVAPGGFPGSGPLIMATYLTGQLLIVLGFVHATPPHRRRAG